MTKVNLTNLAELAEAREAGIELVRVPVLISVQDAEAINAKCVDGKQFSDFVTLG